jgi:hypothetical protein
MQTVPLVSGTSTPANVTFPLLKGELLEVRLVVDRPIVEAFLMVRKKQVDVECTWTSL